MKTFRKLAEAVELGYMFHGSEHRFDRFKVDSKDGVFDRALGAHFAADRVLAEAFATGSVGWKGRDKGSTGWLYKAEIPKKLLVIPKTPRDDDNTMVRMAVAHQALLKDQDLFRDCAAQSSFEGSEVDKAWQLLVKGAPTGKKADNRILQWYGAICGSSGTGRLESRTFKTFRSAMAEQGIVALSYQNTFSQEAGLIKDRTCYIHLFPAKIKLVSIERIG